MIALQDSQHDASARREVLDAGDEGCCIGESLRISSDTNVETHLPDFGFGDFSRHGEPDHEVAGEVEDGADGEDEARRSELVDEAGDDAGVGSPVLAEADQVEGGLVVA